MDFLLFNNAGRLRSGWRFLIFVFAFLFCAAAVNGFLFSLAKSFPSFQDFLTGNGGFIVQNLTTLAVAAGLGFLLQKLIEDLPWKTLGWTFQTTWLRDFVYGFGFGGLTLIIAIGIALAAGTINFQANNTTTISLIFQSFIVSLLVFAVGAAAEETLFRGYALQTLARARLAWLGIIITSLSFAFVHLGNPNVVPFFTFLNTALAGVWLGVAYLKTRSFWFPFSVHFAWNWLMNQFLGIPVSGITRISPEPFLRSNDTNDLAWLSGGDYGIEGGAACTIALALSTLLIWFSPFLKPNSELLALTSQENPVETNNRQIV